MTNHEAARGITNGKHPDVNCIPNEYIADFLAHCWNNYPEERLTIDDVIDFITNPQFYSYFNSLDHESIKRYLDIYGDEFNNLKNKFNPLFPSISDSPKETIEIFKFSEKKSIKQFFFHHIFIFLTLKYFIKNRSFRSVTKVHNYYIHIINQKFASTQWATFLPKPCQMQP